MNFTLSSKAVSSSKADCVVVAVPEQGDWPESTQQVDEALGGLLKQLVKSGDISGRNATTLMIPVSGQPWPRVLVVGSGKDADRNPTNYRKALIAAVGQLKDGAAGNVLLALADSATTGDDQASSEAGRLSLIGRTLEDQLYTFHDYKSEKPKPRKLKKVTVSASATTKALKSAFELGLDRKSVV